MEITCAKCQKVIDIDTTDQGVVEELNANFPGYKPEDCYIVCDDCYQETLTLKRTLEEYLAKLADKES